MKQKNHCPHSLRFALVRFAVSAEAQQSAKVPRIGYFTGATPDGQSARIEAFRQGLRELGYIEGKNIVIEYRYAEGKLDRYPALAAELVRLKVDVIVTGGGGTNPCCQRTQQARFPLSWRRMVILLPTGSSPVWRDRRKHHGTIKPCPGDERETTGDFEGDYS